MVPAAAPTPAPINAPLPGSWPVPAAIAAPLPAPTAAPVTVPQPTVRAARSERPTMVVITNFLVPSKPSCMATARFICHPSFASGSLDDWTPTCAALIHGEKDRAPHD